jgi:YHS domain-containing protein
VVALAARDAGVPVIDLGAVPLKNVTGAVPLFSLAFMLGAGDTIFDPVCGSPVDRRSAPGRLRYKDGDYWFCSLACAGAFASNPGWHVKGDGSR